ncbi:MAG: hypothetical protein EXR73_00770 [Myxococcales bacterium]|nr:hypothetical protein [Myxococcales bacterium]
MRGQRAVHEFAWAACVVCVLFVDGRRAGAEEQGARPAAPGLSRELVVVGQSGAFELVVTPQFLTTIHLPEPVVSAVASDQKNFDIKAKKQTVTIRPLTSRRVVANVNLETEHLHLTLILRVGAEADAVSQVIFTGGEPAAVVAARTRCDEEIRARTDVAIARRLLSRMDVKLARASMQGRGHGQHKSLTARVTRTAWLGEDLYVALSLANQGRADFSLAGVTVRQAGAELPVNLVFAEAAPDERTVARLPAGGGRAGVLVIRGALVRPGRPIDVVIRGTDGTELLLAGIRVD